MFWRKIVKIWRNFENFIDNFESLFRKIWMFEKILIKFFKKINKKLNFPLL